MSLRRQILRGFALLSILILAASCGKPQPLTTTDSFKYAFFENFTGSTIVVKLGKNTVEIPDTHIGFLSKPDLENGSSIVVLYWQKDDVWTKGLQTAHKFRSDCQEHFLFTKGTSGKLTAKLREYHINELRESKRANNSEESSIPRRRFVPGSE